MKIGGTLSRKRLMRRHPQWAPRILLLKKAATLSLLFSFILSPLASFAQETPQLPEPSLETVSDFVETPTTVEIITTEPEPETRQEAPPSQEITDEGDGELVSPEPEMQAAFSGSTQAEGGALFINNESTKSAAPKTDTQSGELTYEYPLTIPPGRNGMEPKLSLKYSSNDTENTSPFGYGWSVSIPNIKRISKTGVNNLYTSDSFTSSLDGELVRVGTTTRFTPRVENGEFRTYELQGDVWTVIEKNGNTLYFGTTTNARQDNPATTTQIYSWHLEREIDTNGNYVSYTYYKDGGALYPSTITYTNHASTTGIFQVEFFRETRADNLVSYKSGFAATSTHRINRIEAKVNGTWVSKYDLTYTTGHNGNRSLLASIVRSGQDTGTSVVTLPATNFTYETYSASDKGWTQSTAINVPVNIVVDRSNQDDGARFVDINGDTYPDIVRSFGLDAVPSNPPPHNITHEVYIGDGTGWATSTSWTIPSPISGRFGFATPYLRYGGGYGAYNVDLGARFADVNADGYTDIVWAYRTTDTNIPAGYSYDYVISDVYVNNKVNGWATTTDWTLPSGFLFGTDSNPSGGVIADVNGDLLPDLLIGGCSAGSGVFLNTGAGWAATSTVWTLPEPTNCGGTDFGTRIADLNGDGLADVVRAVASDSGSYPSVSKVYLNTGSGWSHNATWSIPVSFAYHYNNAPFHYSLSRRLVDVNGDNLPDIIGSTDESHTMPDGDGVYINTGEGWSQDSNWSVPPYFKFTYSSNSKTYYAEAGFAEMDFDGDNLIDFVKSGMTDSYPTYPHDESIHTHKGKVPDLLSSIEYPEGGEITISYEQSARYKSGATLLNPELSSNLNTVETVTYDDGVNTPYENTYVYGGGVTYYASSTDKQFAGFATTTKTDAFGNDIITYIHQGNGSQSALGEYQDSFEKIGKPYLVEVKDGSNLYKRSIYTWESTPLATSSSYVFSSQEINQDFDGDTDHRDRAIEYTYDNKGNVLTKIEWGEVTATLTDGYFADIGNDKRTISYEYASSSSSQVNSLPSREHVTDQSSSIVRESKFFYDNQTYGAVDKGNLTKREDWIAGSTYAPVIRSYDSAGLLIQEISPIGATTTYAYDSNNLYPATITNALGHTATSTYDYSSGKKKLSTDPNGYQTEFAYDGLDRSISEKRPDPASGQPVLVADWVYTDTRNNNSTKATQYLTASSSVPTFSYYDGFGRRIQERSKAENQDEYIIRDWQFGAEGLLEGESLPYFDEDSDDTSPTTVDELWLTYEYDPLSRKTLTDSAVGTETNVYDQWTVSTTDQLGRVKGYEYDAYGRLAQVAEHIASTTQLTSYEWNHNDNLVSLTDALSNTRAFEYDGLGRRTSAEDLHAPADGTYGTWTYVYDAAGNITSVTDPRSQTIERTYDLLNRMTAENYLGASGIELQQSYDTCTNGKGMLCSATTTGSTASFTYNPSGRIASETKVVVSTSFTTQFGYDRQGNYTEITYPDGSAVRYTYNPAGKVETVEQKESGSTYAFIVSDTDYGPNGLVTYQQNGNGTFLKNVYDEEQLYRLARKIVQSYASEESQSMVFFSGNAEESESQMHYAPSEYFNADRSLKNTATDKEDARELKAPKTGVNESISLSTTPRAQSELEVRLKKLPANAKELKFKAPVDRHLGKVSIGGLVRYAYRTDLNLEALPADKETQGIAAERGLTLTGEVKEKRTAKTRTFATTDPNIFVAEIYSGDPRYYKDESGSWWLAEYGITTKESYDLQVNESKDAGGLIKKAIDGVVSLVLPKRAYASTGTFYPDAHPEVTTFDGYLYCEGGGNWSYTRGQSNCGAINDDQTDLRVISERVTSSRFAIDRSFILFDTSVLPDTSVVTTAEVTIYNNSVYAPGSEKRIYLVSSNPGSNTALSSDDYDQLGTTPYGETDNSFTDNTFESIAVNESGKNAISKTGVTKFGLRTHGDLYNIQPTNSTEVYASFASSEAGSTYRPKLVLTYGVAPGVATGLIGRQKANPQEIGEVEPEFSGVYVDPDATDTATAYQIQVSTSPSDWSSPVWDSGKVTLGTPVQNGYRTSDIPYSGGALTEEVTYYWRMKFWDSTNLDSLWSTTTVSFILKEPPAPLIDYVYDYDAVGNITSITDIADPGTAVAKLYAYDELNRLTSVATTSASVAHSDDIYGKIVIQPDHTAGKDSMRNTNWSYSDGQGGHYNNFTTINIGGLYTSYIEFPITSVPDVDDIRSATIQLFNSTADSSSNSARLLQITQSWTEQSIDQHVYPNSTSIGMGWQPIASSTWWVADVTQLVKDWKSGAKANYGVVVEASDQGNQKNFYSSEYMTDPALRPKLVIRKVQVPVLAPEITLATTTSVIETYTYNAIGNILTKTGEGTYSYVDSGYENPHAVTSIASTTYTYDQNGNLAGYTGGNSFSWDYMNRMIGSTVGATSTSYAYDHAGSRVSKQVGSVVSKYPNTFYETIGSSTRKHVYAGGDLVSTVFGTGTSTASTTWVHSDHLGSTVFTTNSQGLTEQGLEYDSFGEQGSTISSGLTQNRGYIGQYQDADTNLIYLNARYYDGARGQFLSQDPVFWEVGQTQDGKSALMNPQSQNSYSYAGNNPITFKDPTGRFWEVSFTAVAPSRAFSVGIKGDGNGVSGFASGGAGAGFSAGLGFGWSPNRELSHKNEGSINASGQAGAGLGLRVSQDLVSGSEGKYQTGGQSLVSVVVGGGASASVQEELSTPLVTWGSPRSELGSTANIPATISAPDPSVTYTKPGRFGGILGGVLNSAEKALNKINPTTNKSSNKQTKP